MSSFWRGATRADGDAVEAARQRLAVQGGDLRAGQGCAAADAGLARDGARRFGVVAGDHHDAQAGFAAGDDRARDIRAQGIGERNQAKQLESEGGGILGPGPCARVGTRHRQHPQALAGHVCGGGQCLRVPGRAGAA